LRDLFKKCGEECRIVRSDSGDPVNGCSHDFRSSIRGLPQALAVVRVTEGLGKHGRHITRTDEPDASQIMTEEQEFTLRRRIQELLLTESCTVRDLSQILRASEKEILSHLPNVARSASRSHKFEIIPAECLACGFTFKRRTRFTIPGKCPLCRSSRILPPSFRIV